MRPPPSALRSIHRRPHTPPLLRQRCSAAAWAPLGPRRRHHHHRGPGGGRPRASRPVLGYMTGGCRRELACITLYGQSYHPQRLYVPSAAKVRLALARGPLTRLSTSVEALLFERSLTRSVFVRAYDRVAGISILSDRTRVPYWPPLVKHHPTHIASFMLDATATGPYEPFTARSDVGGPSLPGHGQSKFGLSWPTPVQNSLSLSLSLSPAAPPPPCAAE